MEKTEIRKQMDYIADQITKQLIHFNLPKTAFLIPSDDGTMLRWMNYTIYHDSIHDGWEWSSLEPYHKYFSRNPASVVRSIIELEFKKVISDWFDKELKNKRILAHIVSGKNKQWEEEHGTGMGNYFGGHGLNEI